MSIIKDLYEVKVNDGWRYYDQQFRNLRKSHMPPLQKPIDELYNKAVNRKLSHHISNKFNPNFKTPTYLHSRQNGQNQPFRNNKVCFAYNKKVKCPKYPCIFKTSAQCAKVHTQSCLVHLSSHQAKMDKLNIVDQYKKSLVTVPTPVRSDILETELQGHDTQQTVKLVNGFKFGFRLGFQRDSTTLSSAQKVKNHKSALQNRKQVFFLKLAKESIKNRIAGPFPRPPFENLNCSSLGLVSKNVSRIFRLIHDLSYPKHFSINAGIPQENSWVQYEGIGKVIDLVKFFILQ